MKRILIFLQIIVFAVATPLSAQAKLVHTLSELKSEQMLRRFVFETNNEKFSLKKSIAWLKKNYPTKEDHLYIDEQAKKIKAHIKPVLFYYDGYIEIRSHGRSYGKISGIDTLKNIIQLNNQDIYFKEGQSISNIHQQIISAMEGHVTWSPLDLFIPKAEAFGNLLFMASTMALFFSVQKMRQAQASTYEGNMQGAAVDHCKNPGTTSRSQSLSYNDRRMINFAFHNTTQDCSIAANQFLIANPPLTADRSNRAYQLCVQARKIKHACDLKKLREATPTATDTAPATEM